jgi:hypothetical protein
MLDVRSIRYWDPFKERETAAWAYSLLTSVLHRLWHDYPRLWAERWVRLSPLMF